MNITDQNVISGSAPAVPGDGWHLFIKLDFNDRLWTAQLDICMCDRWHTNNERSTDTNGSRQAYNEGNAAVLWACQQ